MQIKNHHSLGPRLIPIVVYCLGIWYFCLRILGFGLNYIPGDLGDSRFINFILEHGHQWLIGNKPTFWDGCFMYPFQNTIALSDNLLAAFPFYSLWRLMGFELETSYQLWWLTMCSLNYWISYFVFKKWNYTAHVSAMLAWLFAFSLFNIGQLNYAQMIVRFMVPVAFYAAYKLLTHPSRWHLSLYLIAVAAQQYLVMYTGIYLLYFSIFFMLIYVLVDTKKIDLTFYFKKHQLKFTLMACVAFLCTMAFILMPYLKMSETVGYVLYKDVIVNLPSALSFIFPHESSVLWGFLFHAFKHQLSNYWLQYLFPGMMLLCSLIISTIYLIYVHYKRIPITGWARASIITALLLPMLHLHVGNGLSLYAIIFKLPGINSMRVPIRFMHVDLFLLVLSLGYFTQKLKPALILLLFTFAFLDNMFDSSLITRTNKSDLIARRNHLTQEILHSDAKEKKIIVVVDSIQPAFITHLDAMIAAQQLGLKTINGYSSYCDGNFGEFLNTCNSQGLNKWLNHVNLSKEEILVIKR